MKPVRRVTGAQGAAEGGTQAPQAPRSRTAGGRLSREAPSPTPSRTLATPGYRRGVPSSAALGITRTAVDSRGSPSPQPRGPDAACQPRRVERAGARAFPRLAARGRQSARDPRRPPSSRVILTLHRRLPSPPPPPPPSLSSPPPRKRRDAPRSRLTGRLGGPGPRPPLRPHRPRMRRPPAGTIRGRGRATAGSASKRPGLADTHALPACRTEAGALVRKVSPTPRETR